MINADCYVKHLHHRQTQQIQFNLIMEFYFVYNAVVVTFSLKLNFTINAEDDMLTPCVNCICVLSVTTNKNLLGLFLFNTDK